MVSLHKVDEQLKQIGVNFQYWGRRELRELSKMMTPTEEIKQVVNGHYQGGFAMLVATNKRLLLIDRKPMFLTVEAIWYDKIGQVDFNHRLLNASICVSTPNKELNFTSWNNVRLREIMLYTQEKMTEAKDFEEKYYQDRQKDFRMPDSSFESAFRRSETPVQRNVGAAWRNENEERLPAEEVKFSEEPKINYSLNTASFSRNRLPYSRKRYFGSEMA